MAYKKSVTVIKTVEPAAVIIPIAEATSRILSANGIDISADIIYPVIIGIYGAAHGIINFIKHRKKR